MTRLNKYLIFNITRRAQWLRFRCCSSSSSSSSSSSCNFRSFSSHSNRTCLLVCRTCWIVVVRPMAATGRPHRFAYTTPWVKRLLKRWPVRLICKNITNSFNLNLLLSDHCTVLVFVCGTPTYALVSEVGLLT